MNKDSWLYQNHTQFQFGLLFLGLCARLWVLNSNRLALGYFLLATIGSALIVGYAYGGKSWCHYICPMAPVQQIFGEPRGLFAKSAHEDDYQKITQSMCRTITPEGEEKANCVACYSSCIDVDAERAYFDKIESSQYRGIYYAYIGLVFGYYLYPYLYSGSWDYYFSGIWADQGSSWAALLKPGLFLFGRVVSIPKLLAVPLVLGLCTIVSHRLGIIAERRYRAYCLQNLPNLSKVEAQHRVLSIVAFLSFNYFFVFGGRPFILLLPSALQYFWLSLVAMLSSLWLYRTWNRSPQIYFHESLASRLRKQLAEISLRLTPFLEGRSLNDLSADEVYVLAKVLPGFTHDKRLIAYQAILSEGLEEGSISSKNSLELFQHMREELAISDDEHRSCLAKVRVRDPKL